MLHVLTKQNNQEIPKQPRELLKVMDTFIPLIVVTGALGHTRIQMHKIAHTMCGILYTNYTLLKLEERKRLLNEIYGYRKS
jgi:hypothetical protein